MTKITKTLNIACIVGVLTMLGSSTRFLLAAKPAKDAVIIAVSPTGSDLAEGTKERPFQSLQRAQEAVRKVNSEHDVTVELAGGMYRLAAPLLFAARDGGGGPDGAGATGCRERMAGADSRAGRMAGRYDLCLSA